MRNLKQLYGERQGSTLVTVVIFSVIVAGAVATIGLMSVDSMRDTHDSMANKAAYYHAENALLEAAARISEAPVPDSGDDWEFLDTGNAPATYTLANGDLFQAYEPSDRLKEATLVISRHPDAALTQHFVARAWVTYDGERRGIEAVIQKDPPSQIFDYEYFLNNWGWWWGSSISGNGDNRTNGDFDFRYSPEVNGHVYAAGDIAANQVPIDVNDPDANVPLGGLAGDNPAEYIHSANALLEMPNLSDFSYYESKALADLDAGAGVNVLSQNGTNLVEGVHGNAGDPRGIYLEGTAANPIVLNGTVVIHGDVVIKGPVEGQGTLYVGGNLYIADNTTYSAAQTPNFSTPPATMSKEDRDAWVENNENAALWAFAVRESVLAGDINSSQWQNYTWGSNSYGLKLAGDESQLGPDGIPGTADDNDVNPETGSSWYDVDQDGVIDDKYNFNTDFAMDAARANMIDGYPKVGATPKNYSDISSRNIKRLDGIFYCNHAFGLRTESGPSVYNGSVICRDEAMVFTQKLTMNYDPRVHSRYHDNANSVVDLGLPSTETVVLHDRRELALDEMY